MAIERWNPFGDLFSLQGRMNSLFDDTFRGLKRGEEMPYRGSWMPAVDVHEDTNNVYLEAELPGIKQDEINVKIENNTLTLSGQRNWEKDEESENYHRIERSYGSFVRTFSVPSTVDAEKVLANYKDGVLKVTLPKKAESKPREISVKVSS